MKTKAKRNGWLRAAALLLVLLMAASALAGCAGDETKPQEKTEAETEAKTEESTVDTSEISGVPDGLTFSGDTVNIMLRNGYTDEFNPDEASQDLINSTVVARNQSVEERLDIELNYDAVAVGDTANTKYLDTIRNMVNNNMVGYDILTTYGYYGSALAAEGLYYDLNTADEQNYIKTEGSWYNQPFIEECTIADRLMFVVGDATLSATDRTIVTFFNDSLLRAQNADYDNERFDLFDDVLDGKWTLEYLKTLVAGIYQDLDSNNTESIGDLFGLYVNGGSMCLDAMIMAVGIRLTDRDSQGQITLKWGTSSAVNAYDRLLAFIQSGNGVFFGKANTNDPSGKSLYWDSSRRTYRAGSVFMDGQAVFAFECLEYAKKFATVEKMEYGILPLPKLDSTQTYYASTPQDYYSIVSLPANINTGKRLARTTATLELLSWYSYRDVRPVYMDTAYKLRYASSAKTALLFDRILDGVTYDFGALYGSAIDNPLWVVRNALISGANLKGLYDSKRTTMENKLSDLYNKLSNLSGGGAE